MRHHISCTRCGNTHAVSADSPRDWDEITCTECGEFIDTYGHQTDLASPSYTLHALNLSRGLILQMARESVHRLERQPAMRRSA